ncbi:FtsX-like permease family protein [Actinomadura madurae]|uniref:FtsX-like permease family protein n=1 Tax=Actinomadura madurae TaxID=1993 RepID=UPI000DA04641|nr:FtsX-like permease family protein [Actinomadura madurae]SPT50190.1 acidobacterial duplicated orphan permease [Actinomadura madurae]
MRGLWLRLLSGSGRSARLEAGLPFAAGAVITLVLLLLLGLQQGLDERAERTAWRTPEAAAGRPTVIQAGVIDYAGERPIAVVELAGLVEDPPDVPGMGRFPRPGELWASPALAELMTDLPDDQLSDRFGGPVSAVLGPGLLESPDELVAVVGRSPDDPSMTDERPEHQWNAAASLSPTKIDHWSTEADLYQTTYRDIALLVAVLIVLPLASLGGLASRLMAGRRRRRIAVLRLLGAGTSQVVRLAITELICFAGIGALAGVVAHRLLLPLAAQVPIKGGGWFRADVQPGLALTFLTAVAVVLVLTLGALSGLVSAVRDPLSTYRGAQRGDARMRWWSVLFIGAAVALFWTRSSNPFVTVAFTVLLILGWGLLSTGPWIVSGLGRLLARTSRGVPTFIAGRRLADDPRGAWRAVGGMAMASFIAGFVAVCLPVGLGNEGDYAARADRLEFVLPARDLDHAVSGAADALRAAGVPAEVSATAPPSWLAERDWGTLTVATSGDANRNRVRTTLADGGLRGPELRLSDDIPVVWLLRDGVVVSLLVLPVAALVALTSMVIGAIARIYDQRESLIALTLAGTPRAVLHAARRREMTLPTVILGGIAAAAGLLGGSTLGVTSLVNPYSSGIFLALLALGGLALLLADRTTRPVLDRTSTDLSERE